MADNRVQSIPLTPQHPLGDRAFPVAASRPWNSLPVSLRAAHLIDYRYLPRGQLKTLPNTDRGSATT